MAQKHKSTARPPKAAKPGKLRPDASARGPAPRSIEVSGAASIAAPAATSPAATVLAADASGALCLGASLTIREVGEYAAQLKALFAAGSADVDAHQLESVDTAGLQLLLAAGAAARRHGLTLKLRGVANLNSGAAVALGLADHLSATAEILP
jgi:anti-anti-sigma regulatory factor